MTRQIEYKKSLSPKKKKIEKKGGFSEKRANFDDIYEGNSPYFRRNFRQIFN